MLYPKENVPMYQHCCCDIPPYVCIYVSLGTNSSMFANCSSFGDVREVQSSVLGLKVMFGEVRSSVLMFGEHYEHLGS